MKAATAQPFASACHARGGSRSNVGVSSAIWWKSCLSTVRIAICALPKMLGSSSVPTFKRRKRRTGYQNYEKR
jgi:hypothetical protein